MAVYPTIEQVHEALEYRDGRLYWKRRPRSHFRSEGAWKTVNTKFAGREAGFLHWNPDTGDLRHVVTLFDQDIARYVLVWAIVHNSWPESHLDHINQVENDDHPQNLRLATRSQNGANRSRPCHNRSGFKGVAFHKGTGKWQAQIRVNKRLIYLGIFADRADAAAAYRAAAKRYFGEFSCVS